jgi:hypothetical protein
LFLVFAFIINSYLFGDSAAMQLGVSLSWGAVAQDSRKKWRKLAARLPLAPVTVETKPIYLRTSADGTDSV